MAVIVPEGEAIRKAIKWISDTIDEDPSRPLAVLTCEAISRFDLSPKDADFLLHFYRKNNEQAGMPKGGATEGA